MLGIVLPIVSANLTFFFPTEPSYKTLHASKENIRQQGHFVKSESDVQMA